MADVDVGAVGGIEAVAAIDENVEFCFERDEVRDACAHVVEFVVDQGRDVSTGDVAVVAETDDAGNLGQGEACCLAGLNIGQPGECGCVVGAVAVGTAFGCGQEAFALVEPDGLAGQTSRVGELADLKFLHRSS